MTRVYVLLLFLVTANICGLSAKTITVKAGNVIDTLFFERVENVLKPEKFASDEIIVLLFFRLDTVGWGHPKIDLEFLSKHHKECWHYLTSGSLPDTYYILAGPVWEHNPDIYTYGTEPVPMIMVRYKRRTYYLHPFLNNVLFRIIGEKRIQQVKYSSKRMADIAFPKDGDPVIYVDNDQMSLLAHDHPIFYLLNE